jgi:hypothetical protein
MVFNFLCRLFSSGCEPPRPEKAAAPTTSADLGQKEAKTEARSEEQLKRMEQTEPRTKT